MREIAQHTDGEMEERRERKDTLRHGSTRTHVHTHSPRQATARRRLVNEGNHRKRRNGDAHGKKRVGRTKRIDQTHRHKHKRTRYTKARWQGKTGGGA